MRRTGRMQVSQEKLESRRSFRKLREKQLLALEIVPAKKISQHIQSEETTAAIRIQSHWRAHAQRKVFSAKRKFHRENAAAIVIQKQVRKYFKKEKKEDITVC
uniref:Uncharacterized protein n=1 Tax=Ciona savignyi TaxID=51511 RepID=H2Y845_CIOSA